jgi:hypothetical protein
MTTTTTATPLYPTRLGDIPIDWLSWGDAKWILRDLRECVEEEGNGARLINGVSIDKWIPLFEARVRFFTERDAAKSA